MTDGVEEVANGACVTFATGAAYAVDTPCKAGGAGGAGGICGACWTSGVFGAFGASGAF